MTNASTANKMTETEYAGFVRGRTIVRLIPGVERIAQNYIDMGRDDLADEVFEGLVEWDDELKSIGWVRSPAGWVCKARERVMSA